MAAQKGRDLLIKMDVSSVFTTVAGLRQASLRVADTNVDVSSTDETDRWRRMLSGAGVKSVSVSGSGVFKDSAVEAQLLSNKLNGAQPNFQVIVPGLGTFEGAFVIGDVEYAGNFDGEVTYSISLESAGAITFTPA